MKTTDMRESLRAMAAESAGMEASPRVRRELLAELSGRRKRAGWRRAARWSVWPAAAAACLVAGFWIGTDRRGANNALPAAAHVRAEPAPAGAIVEPPSAEPVAETATPEPRALRGAPVRAAGSAVEYAAISPWFFHSGLPAPATARVVRMEVSGATAEQFGVYADGPQVAAEILVGDDGLARAIRFLRTTRRSQTMRASLRQE